MQLASVRISMRVNTVNLSDFFLSISYSMYSFYRTPGLYSLSPLAGTVSRACCTDSLWAVLTPAVAAKYLTALSKLASLRSNNARQYRVSGQIQ